MQNLTIWEKLCAYILWISGITALHSQFDSSQKVLQSFNLNKTSNNHFHVVNNNKCSLINKLGETQTEKILQGIKKNIHLALLFSSDYYTTDVLASLRTRIDFQSVLQHTVIVISNKFKLKISCFNNEILIVKLVAYEL